MVDALMREPHPRDLRNGSHSSIVLNGHCEEDGAIVYREACKLGGDKRRSTTSRCPNLQRVRRRARIWKIS